MDTKVSYRIQNQIIITRTLKNMHDKTLALNSAMNETKQTKKKKHGKIKIVCPGKMPRKLFSLGKEKRNDGLETMNEIINYFTVLCSVL